MPRLILLLDSAPLCVVPHMRDAALTRVPFPLGRCLTNAAMCGRVCACVRVCVCVAHGVLHHIPTGRQADILPQPTRTEELWATKDEWSATRCGYHTDQRIARETLLRASVPCFAFRQADGWIQEATGHHQPQAADATASPPYTALFTVICPKLNSYSNNRDGTVIYFLGRTQAIVPRP
jgi:hypothetical protein